MLGHGIPGALALMLGVFQFSTRLRQRNLQLHRILGRIYVGSAIVAAPLAVAVSIGGCTTTPSKMTGAQAMAARRAQIEKSVQLMSEPPGFAMSSKGTRYRLVETSDTVGTEPESEEFAGAADADTFAGTKRKAVKTSLLDGVGVESFDSTTALIATLPADDSMTSHDPPIDSG